MAENRQSFRISKKTEVSGVKRQIDFQVEKDGETGNIVLQIQENTKRVLNISVHRTLEESEGNKYYKFTIDVDSENKNFKVELTTEIHDLTKIDFKWLSMTERVLTKSFEEFSVETNVRQFVRDLFLFIEESVGLP
ncbi:MULTISPECIES: hypothetical protein [Thermoprotei]|uniref:hypothetical protein n=1 Tax=Thermoprotei TaxID=183924 RepID=UPI0031613932